MRSDSAFTTPTLIRDRRTATPCRSPLATLILSSHWLQLPLYLGLIIPQGVYVVLFLRELWHLISEATSLSEQQMMLIVLALIDMNKLMIAGPATFRLQAFKSSFTTFDLL